jgi:hypothetical protein
LTKHKGWKRVLFWARIPIVVIATAFPVVFAKHIESLDIGYIVGFILLVAFGAGVEVLYDREVEAEKVIYDQGVASELEGARRRLQAQKAARGLTMRGLLELLSPLMGVLANQGSLSLDQKKTAAQALNKSIQKILKATCEDVWTNWNEPGSTAAPFKASVMVAYKIENCDPTRLAELKGRLKFVGFGRDDLKSYRHILDVQLWSDDDNPLFVPIAIPVEDESDARGVKRLLPGAPTAFAQGEDVIISDTHELQGHFGPDLEADALKEERDYFDSRKIRSMACLVLHENPDKKQNQNRMGVLNIHSDKVDGFGTTEAEQLTIVQSLAHYRTALEFFLDGQQQLTA